MNLKTLCFIPCCGAKRPGAAHKSEQELWFEKMGIDTALFLKGRKEMVNSIKSNLPTKALDLYTGNFYQPLDKKIINREINSGNLRVYIISAGYGLVDANELIHDYDAQMKSKTARMWRDYGLVGIIARVIQTLRPDQVFGFFSGYSYWNPASSNYRYFFSEALKSAMKDGYHPIHAGCFYRADGLGQTKIPKSLGLCFQEALGKNFSNDFLLRMRNNPHPFPGMAPVIVRYESFSGEV